MKSLKFGFLATLVITTACVPKAEAPPPPPQQPTAAPAPPRVPPPPPPPVDWRDRALTPGSWTYRADATGSSAVFGTAGAPSFTVRCDRARRQITLARFGSTSGTMMTVRTTSGARNLPAAAQPAPPQQLIATLTPRDPFLDRMVFSRGRFTVEAPGTAILIIPAWPEPARVIEDCRA